MGNTQCFVYLRIKIESHHVTIFFFLTSGKLTDNTDRKQNLMGGGSDAHSRNQVFVSSFNPKLKDTVQQMRVFFSFSSTAVGRLCFLLWFASIKQDIVNFSPQTSGEAGGGYVKGCCGSRRLTTRTQNGGEITAKQLS